MPEVIFLEGRQALSKFRLDKLLNEVQTVDSKISDIKAVFWHFIELNKPLSSDDSNKLARILTYGAQDPKSENKKPDFLVVPRLGSISPWSTKGYRYCSRLWSRTGISNRAGSFVAYSDG